MELIASQLDAIDRMFLKLGNERLEKMQTLDWNDNFLNEYQAILFKLYSMRRSSNLSEKRKKSLEICSIFNQRYYCTRHLDKIAVGSCGSEFLCQDCVNEFK